MILVEQVENINACFKYLNQSYNKLWASLIRESIRVDNEGEKIVELGEIAYRSTI